MNTNDCTVLDHFIDGAPRQPDSGQYVDGYNPATGLVISRVARGNAADVDAAVAAARSAFGPWRDLRPMVRGRVLTEIARIVRRHAPALASIERRESGKSAAQATGEIEVVAQYFEFYGGLAAALQGEQINLGSQYHSYTRAEPYGVVAVILPWNAPLNQAARAVAPALSAGNTVVAKPSEATSGSLLALARTAVQECGLPPGVLNVVTGLGQEAGAPLVGHPDVKKVAFTGSLRAGREVGKIAAERVIPLTLELGGKSPDIVFADADLDAAAPGVIRAFLVNSGQVCTAGSRILVERSIHDRFVTMLAAGLTAAKPGSGDGEVAPMTTRAQYEKVQEYYAIAQAEGATAIVGGTTLQPRDHGGGWFVSPTLYIGVRNEMRIAQEEIFGPVAVVIPFDTEAEAIEIANATEYGLAAGIWTRDLARAHRVAAQLEAGQIYVNEYMAGGVETPLGGFKASGYGREKGIEALRHYSHTKCITIRF
ncbi:MAG: aldehyde dehydrogenase family protein [Steroidobacteraceae bacterium]